MVVETDKIGMYDEPFNPANFPFDINDIKLRHRQNINTMILFVDNHIYPISESQLADVYTAIKMGLVPESKD